MNETLNIFGTTYSNVKGLRAHGTSQEILYTFLRDYDTTPTFSGNVITVSDTADPLGGIVRSIDAVDISDSTITAEKIISGYIGYTASGTRVVGNAPENVSGQQIYESGNGILYTPTMVIDVGTFVESDSGGQIPTVLNTFGLMSNLVDLTLTGIIREYSATRCLLGENNTFFTTIFPNLKRLTIKPTEIRTGTGAIGNNSSNFVFGHYAFNGSNLRELSLGSVGGPYFGGAGYFRWDCPVPPGSSTTSVGSLDGMRLTVYSNQFKAVGGFMSDLCSNTILKQYDYQTGDELTN